MHADSPFAAAYSKDLVLVTAAWRGCLARFDDRLGAREPFLLVTGDPGTGKTTLVREAIDQWGSRARVVFVTNPMLQRQELLEEIARRFGADPPTGASKPQLLACLERALVDVANGSQVPVIVLEDAHQLAVELLDELRLLANSERQAERPLEIMLVGLPSLHASLMDPEMAPVLQRIAVHCQVSPLSHKQTRQYVHHRARTGGGDANALFPREVCRLIHERTRGVPRAINSLAAEALRLTREGNSDTVTVDRLEVAAANLSMAAPPPREAVVATPPAAAKPAAPRETVRVEAPRVEAPRVEAPRAEVPRAETPKAEAKPEPARPEHKSAPVPPAPAARESAPTPAPARPKARAAASPPAETPAAQSTTPASPPSDAPSPDAPKADPTRVNDWVSRFVNTGPPRIGSALSSYGAFDSDTMLDDAAPDVVAGAPDSGPPSSDTPAPPPNKPAKPMKLIVLDDLPDDLPSVTASPRTPPPGPVRHRARPGIVGPATVAAAFAVAAIATVLVLTHGSGLFARHDRTAEASTGSADSSHTGGDSAVARALPTRAAARKVAATRSTAPVVTPVDETSAADAAPSDAGAEAAPEAAPAPAPLPPRSRLALEVGTYLDEAHANDERDRLVAETGLKGWVVTGIEYGGRTYRIVLGVFSSQDRAEASANSLIERGLVGEARVVPLPSRHSRH